MFLTILTPTYNREKKLPKLYESLKKQTNQEFQWMIVDDGSVDHTKKLVHELIEENCLKIIYIYKENGGKHTALNAGIKKIDTELTFIADSDDYLTKDAIETILKNWEEVKNRNLCGINFLRGYTEETVIGERWPKDKHIANTISYTCNQKITGDKAEVFRTDILKKVPFPEFENENFFSESYVWIKIAKQYDMLMINKIIYITEYLDGGLTKSGKRLQIKSPNGAMLNAKEYMSKEFILSIQIKNAILYGCYGFFAKKKISEIYKENSRKLLTCFGIVTGFMLYQLWKRRIDTSS